MSTQQLEAVGEHPPRDGADIEALPSAAPSEGDGGGPAGLKGADSGETGQLEDFLYVDVGVDEDSGQKDGDAGDFGAEGQRESTTTCLLCPATFPSTLSAPVVVEH